MLADEISHHLHLVRSEQKRGIDRHEGEACAFLGGQAEIVDSGCRSGSGRIAPTAPSALQLLPYQVVSANAAVFNGPNPSSFVWHGRVCEVPWAFRGPYLVCGYHRKQASGTSDMYTCRRGTGPYKSDSGSFRTDAVSSSSALPLSIQFGLIWMFSSAAEI